MGRVWTQDRVLKAIRGLIKSEIPFGSKRISKDRTANTKRIIKKSCGHAITGMGLHDVARRYCKNWSTALIRAGYEYQSHYYWSPRIVIACIRDLRQRGISIRISDLNFDSSSRVTSILMKHSGCKSTASSLVNAGRRYFGSWRNAVISSDVEYPKIERHGAEPVRWKKKEIIFAIKCLSKHFEDLRVGELWGERYPTFKEIVGTRFGPKLSARKLLRDTRYEFGSWRNGVVAADLSLNRYLKQYYKNRKMHNMALVSHRVESGYNSEGRIEKTLHIGESAMSGEEILLRDEFEVRLEKFIASMPDRCRKLCRSIIDIVLDGEAGGIERAVKLAQLRNPSSSEQDSNLIVKGLKVFLSAS